MYSRDEGEVIFEARVPPAFLLMLLVAPAAALAAASQGDFMKEAVVVGPVTAAASLLLFWSIFWLLGRSTLAQVRRTGDVLICKRTHLFNRGATIEIPIAQTREWLFGTQQMQRGLRDIVVFSHRGKRYTLPLNEAQFFDIEAFEAIARQISGVSPAAHADQRRAGDAQGDENDDDGGERVDVR